ncbi:MAG: hypothetical protein AAF693_03355 [Bacteroidota bacterium]
MDKSRTHIKNLIVLACADGKILDSELNVITEKAQDSGISLNELERWLNNAYEIVLEIPQNEAEREKHLLDMINLGLADGRFCQSEYDLCKMMIDKLPYSHLKESMLFAMRKAKLQKLINEMERTGLSRKDHQILNQAAQDAGISIDELAQLLSGKRKTTNGSKTKFFDNPLSEAPVFVEKTFKRAWK